MKGPKKQKTKKKPQYGSSNIDTMAFMNQFIFLGTGSCTPSAHRAVSCMALKLSNGHTWLFDAGEGAQVQLQQSSIRLSTVTKIFITHLHGDHTFGLPGLMCLLGPAVSPDLHGYQLNNNNELSESATEQKENINGKKRQRADTMKPRLELYGPVGLRDYIRAMLRYSYSTAVPSYVVHEIHHVPYLHNRNDANFKELEKQFIQPRSGIERNAGYNELQGGLDILPDKSGLWSIFDDKVLGMKVTAAPLRHSVPCVGYALEEASRRGRLKAEVIKPLLHKHREAYATQGIDRPIVLLKDIALLKPGEVFPLPDGTTITHEMALEPAKKGKRAVVCWDSADSNAMNSIAQDVDYVIHEATNCWMSDEADGTKEEVEQNTISHGHSTPQMVGRWAAQIGAKNLLLTHFSQRFKAFDTPEGTEAMNKIVASAQEGWLEVTKAKAEAKANDNTQQNSNSMTSQRTGASSVIPVTCAIDLMTYQLQSQTKGKPKAKT